MLIFSGSFAHHSWQNSHSLEHCVVLILQLFADCKLSTSIHLQYDLGYKFFIFHIYFFPSLSLFLQAADLTKPLDKRLYKGTIPTCHDFNLLTRSADSLELLIGFSAGQVQLLDPIKHEVNKLFNEEVSIIGIKCLRII